MPVGPSGEAGARSRHSEPGWSPPPAALHMPRQLSHTAFLLEILAGFLLGFRLKVIAIAVGFGPRFLLKSLSTFFFNSCYFNLLLVLQTCYFLVVTYSL